MSLAENPFQVGLAYGLIADSKSEADQSLLDTLGSVVDATDTDLRDFLLHGKLISYQGWNVLVGNLSKCSFRSK